MPRSRPPRPSSTHYQLIGQLAVDVPQLKYIGQLRFGSLPILTIGDPTPKELASLPPAVNPEPIDPSQLVDIDQIGGAVMRSKRTMRRFRGEMPAPLYSSAGSAPDIWYWPHVRDWLALTFKLPKLPQRLPRKPL